ncbi:MAG: hypothetical protein PHX78_08620 [bacterium]|nr:hypothetical protein [bacterium]
METFKLAILSFLLVFCAGFFLSCNSTGTTNPTSVDSTFTSIQDNIFTPKCALNGCHAGTNPQKGLDLSSGRAFSLIVNIMSVEDDLFRITPGNSMNSYLYRKITNDPRIEGSRMPFGGIALSIQEIKAIADWIQAGALQN